MKKLALGCLTLALVGAATLAVGGYFAYRAARPAIQDARAYLDRFKTIDESDNNLKNRSTYAAPATGELTKEQVDRFARVQEHMRRSLGERFTELDAKYQHLKGGVSNSPQLSMTELLAALKDLSGVLGDARRAQVEALNDNGFSRAEYAWVRSRVYQAAGIEAVSLRIEQVAAVARRGTGIESIVAPKLDADNVPAANRAVIKPYLPKMNEWLPLMFFGL